MRGTKPPNLAQDTSHLDVPSSWIDDSTLRNHKMQPTVEQRVAYTGPSLPAPIGQFTSPHLELDDDVEGRTEK